MITWILALSLVSPSLQEGRTAISPPGEPSKDTVNLGRVRLIRAEGDPFVLVRDLLLANAPPPKPDETPEQRDARQLSTHAPALEQLLRTFIQPPFRPELDQLHVTPDGTLISNVSGARHAWLESFLTLQRRTNCMLDMQFRFIRGPRHAFDRFGLADNATAVLSEPDVMAILRENTNQLEDTATVWKPRLVAWPRLHNSMSVLDKVAYVERWDVRIVEPGKQVIADPVISEAPDGVTIDVKAVLLEDALFGAIVDVKQSQVKRPIPTRKIRLATPDNREVEVASPETTTVSLSATLTLRAGETALFRAPLQDDEHDVAVLVSIRRVDALSEDLKDSK